MNSKLFKTKAGAPQKAVITGMGMVDLSSAPEEVLVKLYQNGCPYLELTEAGQKHPLLMPTGAPKMASFNPEPAVKPVAKQAEEKKMPLKKATKIATKKP